MKKVPVVVMVDPEKGAEIKPFASELAKSPKAASSNAELAEDTTWSATATYNSGGADADGSVDS